MTIWSEKPSKKELAKTIDLTERVIDYYTKLPRIEFNSFFDEKVREVDIK